MIKRALAAAVWRIAPGIMVRQHLLRRKPGLEAELWLVPRLLSGHETAIDVGANRGIWSVQMAGHAGAVEAFEPNPRVVEELRPVVGRKVRIHPVGLSDHAGTAILRFDPDNTGIATIEGANTLRDNPGIAEVVEAEVPIATLDSFAFQDVGLIKIDVEGHEEAVLRGAQETLRRCAPALVIEVEDRHNPGAPARVEAMLAALGYLAFVVHGGVLVSAAEARRRGIQLGSPVDVNNFVFLTPERADRHGLREGLRIAA